jgi:thiol-disulfide isomerase/thioredoxin
MRAKHICSWLSLLSCRLRQYGYLGLVVGLLVAPLARGAGYQAPPCGTAVLRGHVQHATAHTISLLYGATWQGGFAHTATATLTKAGDFRLVVPAPAEGVLHYAQGYAPLALAPHNAMEVHFDAARPEVTLRFRGRGAAANTYLNQAYQQSNRDDAAGRTPTAQAAHVSATQLRHLADAYRQRRRAALVSFAKNHPLPAAFMARQRRALAYEWAAALLAYPAAQPKARQQSGVAALPAGYFDFLPAMHLGQRAADLGQPAFQELRAAYLAGVLRPLADSLLLGPAGHDPAAAEQLYQRAAQAFGSTPLRNAVVAQFLLEQVKYYHADLGPWLLTFRAHNRDSTIARDLRAAMRAHQRFARGQPAPAFSLPDMAGQLVALRELRGKVVYLDFWASWCSPCLAEMPASNALRQRFAGRDVVFVYISIDRQPAAWRQAVAARQLAGPTSVHLRADQEFASAVAQAYEVQSIPSYWLIGRDGRLIQKDAPRPSEGARTVAALEAALQQ